MLPRPPPTSALLWQPPPGTPLLLSYLLSPGEFLETLSLDILQEFQDLIYPRYVKAGVPGWEPRC